jgi:hypothetical protein
MNRDRFSHCSKYSHMRIRIIASPWRKKLKPLLRENRVYTLIEEFYRISMKTTTWTRLNMFGQRATQATTWLTPSTWLMKSPLVSLLTWAWEKDLLSNKNLNRQTQPDHPTRNLKRPKKATPNLKTILISVSTWWIMDINMITDILHIRTISIKFNFIVFK